MDTSVLNFSYELRLQGYCGWEGDYGPEMITHIVIVWELISKLRRAAVTQGFLAGIVLCNSGAPEELSVNAPITHKNSLGIHFPIARTLHKKSVSESFFRVIFPPPTPKSADFTL